METYVSPADIRIGFWAGSSNQGVAREITTAIFLWKIYVLFAALASVVAVVALIDLMIQLRIFLVNIPLMYERINFNFKFLSVGLLQY